MGNRYFALCEFIDHTDPDLIAKVPTPVEEQSLKALLDKESSPFEQITKELQSVSITLSDVRFMFDDIFTNHQSMHLHLALDGPFTKNIDFEKGAVKVIDGNENHLIAPEIMALKAFERRVYEENNMESLESSLSVVENQDTNDKNVRRSHYLAKSEFLIYHQLSIYLSAYLACYNT